LSKASKHYTILGADNNDIEILAKNRKLLLGRCGKVKTDAEGVEVLKRAGVNIKTLEELDAMKPKHIIIELDSSIYDESKLHKFISKYPIVRNNGRTDDYKYSCQHATNGHAKAG
jgi:hypothetical protein